MGKRIFNQHADMEIITYLILRQVRTYTRQACLIRQLHFVKLIFAEAVFCETISSSEAVLHVRELHLVSSPILRDSIILQPIIILWGKLIYFLQPYQPASMYNFFKSFLFIFICGACCGNRRWCGLQYHNGQCFICFYMFHIEYYKR